MTSLVIEPLSVPLQADERGDIRVANSRILLDYVVREFEEGATPETIVENYDTLRLADVYAVIAYYLQHEDEVKGYLQRRREAIEELRHTIEAAQPDPAELRARLLARRAQMEQGHVTPAQ
jgi:uncharacterized protein (DUF433 family)